MSETSHRDFICLLNILDSISKINRYTEPFEDADSFYSDSKSFDAAMMNFVIIGEMAEKLTDEVKYSTEATIDWFKIKGFRNLIAHNYFGIDAEEVWQIITNYLPEFELGLKAIIQK
jgi:uncharacterized protein with HEPN domain